DVSSFSNIQVRLAVQDSDADFENGDYVEVWAAVDGSAVTNRIGAVRGNGGGVDMLCEDADLDGQGDLGGICTVVDFTDFTFSVPGSPGTLEVEVRALSSAGSELFALDNVRILGDVASNNITNQPATAVTDNSAVLNAGFNGTAGTYDVLVYWGESDGGTDPAMWANVAFIGNFINAAPTNLTHVIGGLTSNTTHYFNWRSTNNVDDYWGGSVQTFKTGGRPDVNNDGGALSGTGMADLRGDLTAGASADLTIYWGTSDGGTLVGAWDNAESFGTLAEGLFQTNLLNLLFGIPYYYRAYATNAFGEDWANTSTNFKTAKPVGSGILNLPASSVTDTSAVFNAAFNGAGSVYDVILYWGTTDGGNNPVLWDTTVQLGSMTNIAPTNLMVAVSGLTGGGTYFYTWRASNCVEEIWGTPSVMFSTVGPPVVDNDVGPLVAIGSADLNGNLTAGGLAGVNIYFGDNDGGTTPIAWDTEIGMGTLVEGPFTFNQAGLLYGIQYYYRTFASNTFGADWANSSTNFKTMRPLGAGINNAGVSMLNETSAVMTASFNGAGSVYNVTLYWGPTDGGMNPVGWANQVAIGDFTNTASGPLNHAVNGLTADTTYFYSWRATNCAEVVWGGASTAFTTFGAPLIDNGVGGLGSIGEAILNGNIDRASTADITFYWGTADGGSNAANWQNADVLGPTPFGSFQTTVSGLIHGVQYYYRSFGTNTFGSDWADSTALFKTFGPVGAGIANQPASSISPVSVLLNAAFDGSGSLFDVDVFWGTTDGAMVPANWDNQAFVGSFSNQAPTNLSYTVTGLLPVTTYFFAWRATNCVQTVWGGGSLSFATPNLPDINVQSADQILIPNNDMTPDPVDGTDFGSLDALSDAFADREFRIKNAVVPGLGPLALTGAPPVQLLGDVTDFSVQVQPGIF
ncbi:MAG: hypothetical protein AAF492_07135, partial [Verrucomicrobiota bacterium]